MIGKKERANYWLWNMSVEETHPPTACRQTVVLVVVVVQTESNLLHIIAALHSSCGFTSGLNCGQKKRNQDTDNGDDDEEFNKGERKYEPCVITHRRRVITRRS